jgi:hypothetical protein
MSDTRFPEQRVVFETDGPDLHLTAVFHEDWTNLLAGRLELGIDTLVCVDAGDDGFANVELRTAGKLQRVLVLEKDEYERLVNWAEETVPEYVERYDSIGEMVFDEE